MVHSPTKTFATMPPLFFDVKEKWREKKPSGDSVPWIPAPSKHHPRSPLSASTPFPSENPTYVGPTVLPPSLLAFGQNKTAPLMGDCANDVLIFSCYFFCIKTKEVREIWRKTTLHNVSYETFNKITQLCRQRRPACQPLAGLVGLFQPHFALEIDHYFSLILHWTRLTLAKPSVTF